ncbi:hypothetical protein ACLB1R_05580 [Escherichia coli]
MVFEEAQKQVFPLHSTSSTQYQRKALPTPARRPHNSRLNTRKISAELCACLA